MGARTPAHTEEFLPSRLSLPALRDAAASCRGCPLYLAATRTVFGEGPTRARLALVGEQPGDREDKEGRPFVGPAGRVLDKALAEAGLDRRDVYVTNVVKHFSFLQRGKARIHKKPRMSEIEACHPWIEAELKVVRPAVVVLLGATAAQAVFGPRFRVSRERGRPLRAESPWPPVAVATTHPSSILRAPDSESRDEAFRLLVEDLRVAAAELHRQPAAAASAR